MYSPLCISIIGEHNEIIHVSKVNQLANHSTELRHFIAALTSSIFYANRNSRISRHRAWRQSTTQQRLHCTLRVNRISQRYHRFPLPPLLASLYFLKSALIMAIFPAISTHAFPTSERTFVPITKSSRCCTLVRFLRSYQPTKNPVKKPCAGISASTGGGSRISTSTLRPTQSRFSEISGLIFYRRADRLGWRTRTAGPESCCPS